MGRRIGIAATPVFTQVALCAVLAFVAVADAADTYSGRNADARADVSAVIVVLTHSRSSLLRRTLRSLVEAMPPGLADGLPLFVSVDDNPCAHR
jgi:hypothetical protein